MVFIVAYGWGWWFVTPVWCGVQGLGFSGLIIGVLVECVGDVVCDVFAGGGVDVDGGVGFGLGGVEVGGHGWGFPFERLVWVCPDWFSLSCSSRGVWAIVLRACCVAR